MIRLRHAIGTIGAGVDVLVFSEEEAQRRGQVPGTVVYWANKEGKVLYEAEPHLKPLPVLDGSAPQDWKDAIYD